MLIVVGRCLDLMVDPTVLLCGHASCGFCLHLWFTSPKRTARECPQCRVKAISDEDGDIKSIRDFCLDTAIDGLIAALQGLNHVHWVEGGKLNVERAKKIESVSFSPFRYLIDNFPRRWNVVRRVRDGEDPKDNDYIFCEDLSGDVAMDG